MLKKIIKNLLSLFNLDISKKGYYLNSTFISEKKIDTEIIGEIFKFHQNIKPFYENINLPEELKIGKVWTFTLKKKRKDQLKYIRENNKKDYKKKLEKFFFNRFAKVGNYSESKKKYLSKSHFDKIYQIFESVTEKDVESLTDNNTWSKWGFESKKGIVSYNDLDDGIQAHNINLLINFILLEKKIKRNLTIVDLGSGYGSTIQKLLSFLEKEKKKKKLNLILIDLPLNLTLAYAYLRRIFPKKRILLVSDKKAIKRVSLIKGEKIILIPTIFSKETCNSFKIDILNNQASLSEMDYKKVSFYLNLFINKNLSFFIETNFNNKLFSTDFLYGTKQILSRNFPIPKTHKLLASFNRVGTEKYVTKIYKKI